MAQIKYPKASPYSSIVQEVGLTKIEVVYSRPAVRGRKIFGELVPHGRIWRVGANASTKITISDTITVSGNQLPAGTYALYAFPEEKEWEIAFHTNISHWGDGRTKYNPNEDVFRLKVVPEKTIHFQENFLITFDNISHDTADMIWLWANTKVTIPVIVDTKRMMEAEIEKQLQVNPTAQTYYEAARYYVEQGAKHKLALQYLNKAIALGGDTYYFHRVKSLAEAALGYHETAIVSAEKSLQLANKEGKDEFVRLNQKNIDVWTRKLKTRN
ncbi:DUF2911 domain-containing protein [Costertonia aggregata]|uniref:DUF2911 domain-containing protein n=1 Tax=Costertonia aggregata TaxID=343403 RepID=A0A7H9ALM9_9FLAO|nr:DUF2911 domain-containing protein [Costertonia aggregata]QLG44185.1 DUF2911 domain-containing protein [Costertonia aggregata]